MMLCRQPLTNCLVMIQPALISYSFNSPPQPVLLRAMPTITFASITRCRQLTFSL